MNGYVRLLIILLVLLCSTTHIFSQVETDSKKEIQKKPVNGGREIVITATKSSINPKETGAAVTIITKEEIEKSGKKTVPELLNKVSGATISRSSGLGGLSSIYLRGAHQKDLLVLIDGIEINDSASTAGEYDFAHLTTAGIERIEIIRGPAGVLYGSNASAGVINIITKKGMGKPEREFTFELGSYYTTQESFSVAGSKDYLNYAMILAHTYSRGYSKSRKADGVTEKPDKDSYNNTTARSRFGIDFTDKTSAKLFMNFTGARMDIDDGSFDDDDNDTMTNDQTAFKGSLCHEFNKYWAMTLNSSHAQTIRKEKDTEDGNSQYNGKKNKIDLLQKIDINGWNITTLGIETEKESGDTTEPGGSLNKSIRNNAVYVQNHLKIHDIFYFIAGIRLDDHKTYGKDTNYSLSTSIILPVVKTRLKGNYATSFKAPSLFQLFNPTVGDSSLTPEESTTLDGGIEQFLFRKRVRLEANAHYTKYSNLIDYNPSTFKYFNSGEVEIKGYEFLGDIAFSDNFKVYGGYSKVETKKLATDEELLRRPRHKVYSGFDWNFLDDDANINSSFVYYSSRKDKDFSTWPATDVTLDSYYLIDLAASYWITDIFQIYGRVENILDKDYNEVYGYNTTGRFISLGLKAKF